MATVTAGLTLSSAAGALSSQAVSLSISEDITAEQTSGMAKVKVSQNAAGASCETIFTANQYATTPAYLYIKNMQPTEGEYIYLYDDTSSGDTVILKLSGDDFAFMPITGASTLKVYGHAANYVAEYMIFGTA
tara:strand:- start:1044 stop:1442 length:399 start_codon:yes stop_codon:yes gene_type:complete